MPFDAFTNRFYNIVPEENLPKRITCSRYGTICSSCTCTVCNGAGHVNTINREKALPEIVSHRCKCDKIALSRYRLEQMGLGATVSRYTLDTYKEDTEQTAKIKKAAVSYIGKGFSGKRSFFISGRPGTGKSHICVALTQEIMTQHNGNTIYFFGWVEQSGKLKRNATDAAAYDAIIAPAFKADLLYIDDFFKNSPNEADKRLAMELIGNRYNAGKPCVISSERSLEEISKIDSAIGGRITEMCGNYILVSPNTDRRTVKDKSA